MVVGQSARAAGSKVSHVTFGIQVPVAGEETTTKQRSCASPDRSSRSVRLLAVARDEYRPRSSGQAAGEPVQQQETAPHPEGDTVSCMKPTSSSAQLTINKCFS